MQPSCEQRKAGRGNTATGVIETRGERWWIYCHIILVYIVYLTLLVGGGPKVLELLSPFVKVCILYELLD